MTSSPATSCVQGRGSGSSRNSSAVMVAAAGIADIVTRTSPFSNGSHTPYRAQRETFAPLQRPRAARGPPSMQTFSWQAASVAAGLLDRRLVERAAGLGRAVVGCLRGTPAARRRAHLRVHDRQGDLAVVLLGRLLDHDRRARGQLRAQYEVRERILDVALDRAAQRPCRHPTGAPPPLLHRA